MTSSYERFKRIQGIRDAFGSKPRILVASQSESATSVHVSGVSGDGWVERWSGDEVDSGYAAAPAYPPAGWTRVISGTGENNTSVEKSYYYVSPTQHTYLVRVGLLKFDTSALPDDAYVTGVVLRLYAVRLYDDEARSLTFEWASWTDPRGATGDWTASPGTSAHPGFPLLDLPYPSYSWLEIPLQNGANVSKTGVTALKAHISGGAPGIYGTSSSSHLVEWRGRDYQGSTLGNPDLAPRLVVTYI